MYVRESGERSRERGRAGGEREVGEKMCVGMYVYACMVELLCHFRQLAL